MVSPKHDKDLNLDFVKKSPLEVHIANDIDFFKLFSYIKTKYKNAYLFESLSLPRHQDRYHTLGFDPILTISAKSNTLNIKGGKKVLNACLATSRQTNKNEISFDVDNPYKYIKKNFNFKYKSKVHQGGLIGYFCHESMNYFESSVFLKEHDRFSNFKLGLYLDGLLFDSLTGSLYYYSYGEERSDLFKELVKQSIDHIVPKNINYIEFLGDNETKEEFVKKAKITKEKIRQGYSFQSEVGFKSNYKIKGNKIAIYNKLRQVNPSPYMYYLKFEDEELLGASPEILISSKNGKILTTPTAGTIARGKTNLEDVKLARELLNDPKEIAEHNMLVDLHRNDIAKICKVGSVKIDDLMYIIKFSHVQHIVSNVIGDLKETCDAYDVLSTILPGGVVTGAPKIETVKIINENESSPRGPYGGAVGRFSFNGDCDFCLPIRSIFCKSDDCYAQTSAGIVYDSVPENEYQEVLNKLAAMKQTLSELEVDND